METIVLVVVHGGVSHCGNVQSHTLCLCTKHTSTQYVIQDAVVIETLESVLYDHNTHNT